MAINPSLTDINNQIAINVVDNYLTRILKHLTPNTDPYMPYVPLGMWDPTRGLSQTTVRSIGELPTAMPGAGTALAQNDGTGSSHDLTPTTIKFGRLTRAYSLAGYAFNTDTYQVGDFQHNFQAVDFITSHEQILRKYQRQFITDWKRENLVGNTDRKVAITGTGYSDYTEYSNQTARFGGLDALIATPPTSPLNWGPLQALYDILVHEGAAAYAVGTDELGNPVFPLIAGPSVIRSLFRDTEKISTAVNYNQDYDNLTPYGRKRSVYGFMPIVDVEIPRFDVNYDADGYDNVYLWENATISSGGSGRRYQKNASYDTAAYELFYVPTKQLMEMHVRPAPGTRYSMEVFSQQNYAGSLQWINNKDMDTNPLGDRGYFYMQNYLAAKPNLTDMGYCGLGTVITG